LEKNWRRGNLIFSSFPFPLPFFLKKEIGKGKKTEKKREKEKKEGNKERAGYSASKLRNNQPSKNFYGVGRSVELPCRLARRDLVAVN
jgi:hypothetical protein